MGLSVLKAAATVAVFILPAAASAETLNAGQLKTVMIGTTVSWVTLDGETRGFSRYRPDGSAALTITSPNRLEDRGRWKIVGNEFCSTWRTVRDGREACSTLRTTSKEGLYRMDTVFIRAQ